MNQRTRYTRVQSAFLGALALSMMAGVASAQPAPAPARAPASTPPAAAAPAAQPGQQGVAAAGTEQAPAADTRPVCNYAIPSPRVMGDFRIGTWDCKRVDKDGQEVEGVVRAVALPGSVSWQAAIVGGVGSFVADRAQQEVIQWFVDTMLNDLCTKETRNYFVDACGLQDAIAGSALPSRAAVVAALRADVERLPATVLATLDPKDGKVWGEVMLHLFQAIRAKRPPLQMIAGIAQLADVEASCTGSVHEGPCALMLTSIAVQTFIEVTADLWGVSAEAEFGRTLNDKLRALGRPELGAVDAGALFRQIKALTDMLSDLERRALLLDPVDTAFKQRQLLALGFEISSAVASTISTTAGAFNLTAPSVERFKLSTEALAALVAGKYDEALAPTAKLVSLAVKNNDKFPRAVQRYLPLAMDLARAQTSDDVKTALEAAAEPVGGWRLKRNGFVASVGALAGASAGWEFSLNNDTKLRQSGFVGSVFAPVGFDLSWPVGKDNGSTLGFFVSVLDVGNVVGARFAGEKADDVEEVEAAPVIGFPQVFSPGLYVRAGLGHSPFVLAAGVSWAPQLRRLTLTDGTTEEINAARVYLGLAADVTLFPF